MVKIPASWWISFVILLGVIGVYWPTFTYGFVAYDDQKYAWHNPHVQAGLSWAGVIWAFTSFYAANWHPFTWLSYMLDTQLFGFHPQVYHIVNVLFHDANTVLLFCLLKRMTGALWRSAFVAALFAFHPLHVESVAWISERKDVLSTFFFMLTLMAYVRYAQRRSYGEPSAFVSRPSINTVLSFRSSTLDYCFALLFFALGLMSKPMLVTVPFVMLLLDFWPLKRVTSDKWQGVRLLIEKIPFFVLSAASCVVTFLAQEHGKAVMSVTTMPVEMRVENAFMAYAAYIEKMLWPTKLAACYPLVPVDMNAAITPIFILAIITVAILICGWRRHYLLMGWLWYLGTLVPVIGLVQVGSQSMADRYTYIPLIGLFIAVTWGVADLLSEWPYRRFVLAVASAAVILICINLTVRQVGYWQNSVTLGRHALAVTTNNAAMEVVLGNGLVDEGKTEQAGQHFANALRITPDSVPALGDLALALVTEGKLQEAVDKCRLALKLMPNDFRLHFILANILSDQGKLAESISEYKAVLQIDPNHLFALNNLAWLLATTPDAKFRNGSEAVEYAQRACQLTRYKTTLYIGTLAAAYADAGRFDDAIRTANQAITLATAAGETKLAAKNRKLLELYQAHKAYHQKS